MRLPENRTPKRRREALVLSLLCGAWAAVAGVEAGAANDWPMSRGDAARSGYRPGGIPPAPTVRWIHRTRHAPRPAWTAQDTRMTFDHAHQAVVAGDTLLFGSSADCKVYALDARTGEERWTFFTGGPVRLAPAVSGERAFVASDDGFLYCLGVADGALLWKHRGGPRDDMVLGNDRLVSRWPVRGGPAVAGGVVYAAAGIWPSEGIFVFALDAATGSVRWVNDSAGAITMPQPHGGAEAASGISAQGHLVVAGDTLLVPTGRAVPAALSRADGRFLYFHLQRYGQRGGAEIAAAGDMFFNGGAFFDVASGMVRHTEAGARCAAVTPARLVIAKDNALLAFDRLNFWKTEETVDRLGKKTTTQVRSAPLWSAAGPASPAVSLIAAGGDVVVGGAGRVAVVDLASGAQRIEIPVDGVPYGLAAAGGRLYASTDQGAIVCLGAGEGPALTWLPAAARIDDSAGRAAAAEIIAKAKVTDGYCADLGCGDGALALALARQTNLTIMAIDGDPANVASARRMLDAAGLYGARVTVVEGDPANAPFPNLFANLVVSGRSTLGGAPPPAPEAVARILKPCGGVACIGPASALTATTRPALDGAGDWTHQYCDAGNLGCSADAIARGPLRVLWFRDPDFAVPSRHGRGPAPLVMGGRMYVEGADGIRCVDIYNGRTLWEHALSGILAAYDQDHLMGTAGTGSNMCATEDALYVQTGARCLRIDPATGRRQAAFEAPPLPDGTPGTWGVIACADGLLLGTLADTAHIVKWRFLSGDMRAQFTEGRLLLALDARDGGEKWRFEPAHRIRHNTLAAGGGRIYLIDRPAALGDRLDAPARKAGEAPAHPSGVLIALRLADGSRAWTVTGDIFGTVLIASDEHDVLLMTYQDTRFKLDSEVGGRMAAFRASTGERLWDARAAYRSRPIVGGRTIYAEPGAWDLLTGERREGFTLARSYGCGTVSGSRSLLLFRSATLGYIDLARGCATVNYGGIRPGCWINVIPAGGLVLMPDAARKCVCSYLISASVALEPAPVEVHIR